MMHFDVTVSLVLYQTPPTVFEPAIASLLASVPQTKLWVVDNSPTPLDSPWFKDARIRYLHAGDNLGFGKAHNLAIAELHAAGNALHLLLNPDVVFEPGTLPRLMERFVQIPDLIALMPRIDYPDGRLQRLCKLLPSPIELLVRRFIPFKSIQERINRRYELHNLPQDRLVEVPSISGCFLLVRTERLREVGGFDPRFFMYMEDVDLIRRLSRHGRIMYDPTVSVKHAYGKGSYRSLRLMIYHLRSAVQYFNKWGWWIDAERTRVNRNILHRLDKDGARS